jgi:hypothetical protein
MGPRQAFRRWTLEHYTFFMVKLSPAVRKQIHPKKVMKYHSSLGLSWAHLMVCLPLDVGV